MKGRIGPSDLGPSLLYIRILTCLCCRLCCVHVGRDISKPLSELAAYEAEHGLMGFKVCPKDPEHQLGADELVNYLRDLAHRSVQITDEVFAKMPA